MRRLSLSEAAILRRAAGESGRMSVSSVDLSRLLEDGYLSVSITSSGREALGLHDAENTEPAVRHLVMLGMSAAGRAAQIAAAEERAKAETAEKEQKP